MKNLINFLIKVLALSIFRVEYSADPAEEIKPKEGYEYKELPETQGFNADAMAQDYGLPVVDKKKEAEANDTKARLEAEQKRKADEEAALKGNKKTDEKPGEKKETDTEVVTEVKIEDITTIEQAEELVKDYEDSDEINLGDRIVKKEDFLQEIKIKLKPADEKKIFNVNGTDLDQKTYDELKGKAKEYYGWDDEYIKNIPEKQLAQSLKDYVKAEHIQLGSETLAEKNQELAKIRRELNRTADSIMQQLDDLEEARKRDEEKIAANKELIEKDPYAEDDEEKRDQLKIDQRLAKRENADIEAKNKARDKKIEELSTKAENVFYQSTFVDIENSVPELHLPEPAVNILTKANAGKYPDLSTAALANVAFKVAHDYRQFLENNPESKMKVHEFFYINKFMYHLPEISTNGRKHKQEEVTKKKKVLKLLSSQERTPITTGGKTGDGTLQNDSQAKSIAKRMEDIGMDPELNRIANYE